MAAILSSKTTESHRESSGFVPRAQEDGFTTQLLRPLFTNRQERLVIAGFDGAGRLVQMIETADDDALRCRVRPSQWHELLNGCPVERVFFIHNHPSEMPYPSESDLRLTRDAARHLGFFAIDLAEHLILVSHGHFSFAKAGLL